MKKNRFFSYAVLSLVIGFVVLFSQACGIIEGIINDTTTPGTQQPTVSPATPHPTPTPFPHKTTKLVDSKKLLALITDSQKADFDFESVDQEFCAYIFNRPFLSQLKKEKPEYSVLAAGIYTAIIASQAEYTLPESYSIEKDEILRLVFLLKNESPEFFHMDKSYSYMSDSNDIVKSLKFEYRMTQQEYYDALKKTYDKIAFWSENFDSESDYEREFALYNEIMAKCRYSLNADFRDSAYGAIVLGEALCEGYSHAFMMTMHYNGIKATQLTGMAYNSEDNKQEAHAWNIVFLDGEPYQADATWDDFDDSRTSRSRYTYFNITDKEMMEQRSLDERFETVDVPKCTKTKYNYFRVNNLFVEEDTDLKEMLFEKLSKLNVNEGEVGKTIQLKFESKSQYYKYIEKHAEWVKEWNEEVAGVFGITGFSYYTSDSIRVVSYIYKFGKN